MYDPQKPFFGGDMNKVLFTLLALLLSAATFASPSRFSDQNSGISFDIPEGFKLDDEECMLDREHSLWSYTFVNRSGDQFSVEIEAYDHVLTLIEVHDHMLTLFELLHITLTDEYAGLEEEDKNFLLDFFQFRNLNINDLQGTFCKIRILAVDGEEMGPVYLCDYLFVRDNYGFTFSLLKEGDENTKFDEIENLLRKVLQSVEFTKKMENDE